jgi:TonB family protein
MTKLFPHGRYRLGTWALLMGCVLGLTGARGQHAPAVEPPIVLDREQATNLMLHKVTPEYPPLAKVNYIQGLVSLELAVGSDGRVARAHVTSGNPLLAAAALRAVEAWRFRPYKTSAGPRPFLTSVEMHFRLHSSRLTFLPPEPERDFDRQVTPPEVASRPDPDSGVPVVRLRLLLDDDGQVIDSAPLRGRVRLFRAALKSLARWTFRPARWGTIRLPWYLVVDVPVANTPKPPEVAARPAPL